MLLRRIVFVGASKEPRWKDIFHGLYQVSDTGLVRSLFHQSRYGVTKRDTPRLLKPDAVKGGYLRVTLSRDTITQRYFVHLLVIEAFGKPCPAGMECSHEDGDSANNHLANLKWRTHSENNLLKRKHGTAQCGERGGRAKLTEAIVRKMRRQSARKSAGKLAKQYGVVKSTAQRAISGETWSHL